MKKRYGLTGPEAGQGTVEYMLIVVIIVIIVLSLMYRFQTSFRTYAQAFFDGYIACILEVGELPGTGGTCASEMPTMNAANGKQLLKENLPVPKEGKGGRGGANRNNANNSSRRETKSGGGGGTAVGRLRDSGRQRTSEVGQVGSGNESTFGGESQNGAAQTFANGRIHMSGSSRVVKMDVHADGTVQEKAEVAARPKSAVTKKTVDEGGDLRPIKSIELGSRGVASKGDIETKGFSVGALIRIFIIILIIVAMVIFFGGQLIQIAKSRDKGGGE